MAGQRRAARKVCEHSGDEEADRRDERSMTTVWELDFYVFPEVPEAEVSLLIDLAVLDQWGNMHRAKVQFARRVPDAPPWRDEFEPDE